MLLILLFVCSVLGRTACDFYSRVSDKKNESCVYCIQKGIDNKLKCVYKPMSDWCVSFDETLPLMCAGNGDVWFKTHLYECSLL